MRKIEISLSDVGRFKTSVFIYSLKKHLQLHLMKPRNKYGISSVT